MSSVDATGSSVTPGSDLPAGIYYWRASTRTRGVSGTDFGPTWEFTVGARSAPVDTSWGSNLDVNRDGFADVVVGAWGVDGDTGAAFVYLGNATRLATDAAIVLRGPDGRFGQFGSSVASAGDVNGDGFADVIAGAYQANRAIGRAYVYAGSATGLTTRPLSGVSGPDGEGGGFGKSVAGAGDVNGDGYADVIVGAPFVNEGTGAAYVFLGSMSGLGATPATILTGAAGPHGNFGGSVASAGDLNGDGFGDVVVAAYPAAALSGRVYVYLGSATGLQTSPASSLAGTDGAREFFGGSIACADDINGDGFADLVVGASGAGGGVGRADVFLGSATGLGGTAATRLVGFDGMNGGFGGSVSSAGDANGDGFADIVVGASWANSADGRAYVFLGGEMGLGTVAATTMEGTHGARSHFGNPVASGDVNGDGFGDVLVVEQSMYGSRAHASVYAGSAAGTVSIPATIITGPADPSSAFGASIASGGSFDPEGIIATNRVSLGPDFGHAHECTSHAVCEPDGRHGRWRSCPRPRDGGRNPSRAGSTSGAPQIGPSAGDPGPALEVHNLLDGRARAARGAERVADACGVSR